MASHEGTAKPRSLEAKIVHDADVLEKTGILGIIRHTWKLVHSPKTLNLDSDVTLSKNVFEHLQWRASRLQTILAKNIHHYLTQGIDMSPDFAQKLVSFIRPLAKQNIITENIAKELEQILTERECKKLEEQLSLEYLNKKFKF